VEDILGKASKLGYQTGYTSPDFGSVVGFGINPAMFPAFSNQSDWKSEGIKNDYLLW
jgi:hypothetical protein